jgi:hypothetical protein
MPLDRFAVSLQPARGPVALRVFETAGVRWSLERWEPAKGYVAALAVEAEWQELRSWAWPPGDARVVAATPPKSRRSR